MANSEGGEKTEKATPKKRADARKNGQVLKSQEINTAVMLITMFFALKLLGPSIINGVGKLAEAYLSPATVNKAVNTAMLQALFLDVVLRFFMIIAPVILIAFAVGIAVNIVQVGFYFSSKPIMPKFSKLNPIKGFKNIFSMRSVVELVKSVFKVVVLGAIIYNEYLANMITFQMMMLSEITTAAGKIMDMIMSLAFKVGIAFAIMAAFDYLYQWWKFEKDLRMSKQEVKDEWKLQEGNPEIKGKIKQKQREMSMMRMMQDVPRADVVITNPTEYAVALQYDEKGLGAPRVIAKGKDFVAAKIKQIAAENGVEIVENKPIAQALYVYCDVGDEIPADMYQTIAEILAYVYRLRSKVAEGRSGS